MQQNQKVAQNLPLLVQAKGAQSMTGKIARLAITFAAIIVVVMSTSLSGDAAHLDTAAAPCPVADLPPLRQCRSLALEAQDDSGLRAVSLSALREREARLRTAAETCSSVDEWALAEALIDSAADVAATRAGFGDLTAVAREPMLCGGDGERTLLNAYGDAHSAAHKRLAAPEAACVAAGTPDNATAVDPAQARCAWLTEAGARRAQQGAEALALYDAVDAMQHLSGGLSAFNRAVAVCPAAHKHAFDTARRSLVRALVTARGETGHAVSTAAGDVQQAVAMLTTLAQGPSRPQDAMTCADDAADPAQRGA